MRRCFSGTFIVFILVAGGSAYGAAQDVCPHMPDDVTKVARDVRSDIKPESVSKQHKSTIFPIEIKHLACM